MDMVVPALFGIGAATVWLVLGGTLALLAGRAIHERDVRDYPALTRRRTREVAQH